MTVKTRFESLAEPDLGQLDEEELIEFAVAARRRGDRERLSEALARFAFGRFEYLVAQARVHVADRDEAEDIASQAIAAAMRSALGLTAEFEGASVGEYVNWMKSVVRRRAIDHHRKNVPTPITALERDGDGPAGGAGAIDEPRTADDIAEMVAITDAYERAVGELSPPHREVVRLVIEQRMTAREVSASIAAGDPISENNAHKIVSRFRARMNEILYGGG